MHFDVVRSPPARVGNFQVIYVTVTSCYTTQTEVECTCIVYRSVHCNPSSVAGVYTAHGVYNTLQAAGYTASILLEAIMLMLYTAGGTLHIHFSLCSVAAVFTAQSMQPTCRLHCLYTAGTLHFGLGNNFYIVACQGSGVPVNSPLSEQTRQTNPLARKADYNFLTATNNKTK